MSGQDRRQDAVSRGEKSDSDSESSEEDILVNAPLQQVLNPLPKFDQSRRRNCMPVALDNSVPFFPQPPQGYVFQNTGSSDPAKLQQTKKLVALLNKKETKAQTKAEFEAKGSIVQPPDGDNVKRHKADSCLTCIAQSAGCQGSDVDKGECRNCRGGDKKKMADGTEKKSRAARKCRWKQPERGIWTYRDHIQHHDPERQLPQNTKRGRYEREMTKQNLWPNIWDIPPQSHEGQILRWIAAGVATAGGLSNDSQTNLDAMIEITLRRVAFVSLASNIPDDRTRREVVAAVNEIYMRLLLAREDDAGLTRQQIRNLLPDGHPQK